MDRIVIVGSANMDLVVRAPRLPIPGETILGCVFFTAPGGKGANQAVAAARLGAQVCLVGRVGVDAFGEQLRNSLAAAGVGLNRLVPDTAEATGVALITVDISGQNTIAVASGANMCLTVRDVEAAEPEIAVADVVLAQLETPEDTLAAAARLARLYHVPFILNPAPARLIADEVLRSTVVITPNEIEAEALTGVPVVDTESAGHAAHRLLASGVGAVIVTLGSRGALLVDRSGTQMIPPWTVPAVDATAAGDAFSGALATSLSRGQDLRAAARYASAVAAISVTRAGAQPSMPFHTEVEEFLSEHS